MKIFHYSLGLPPYRSGGLTKYSCDLMMEQARQGDDVYLLFPGQIRDLDGEPEIKFYSNYNGVKTFELINPLPVPLLNGISKPNFFMRSCNKKIFINVLKDNYVKIVHIHTFMGLYIEFLYACKELSIKIVYTTHDYFGMCTKCNFIDFNGQLCKTIDINKCIECNSINSYSINTIRILQSKGYRYLKNVGIIPFLKAIIYKAGKLKLFHKKNQIKTDLINRQEYESLLFYYESIFKLIDKYIFNSNIAKEIFNRYISSDDRVISITHNNIKDNRIKRTINHNLLRISYMGPAKAYKGYFLICDVIKKLYKNGTTDVVLNVYGNDEQFDKQPNIKHHGKYSYSQIGNIFNNTDILIVPSICYETFGFITLEAISYGIPVIATENVGSKDLLISNNYKKGIIIEPDKESIYNCIKDLCVNKIFLYELNNNILIDTFIYTIRDHYKEIKQLYVNEIENV